MSNIERRGLPPPGIKGGSMSDYDGQEYAKEIIRDAFFGSGAFHPDGGMKSAQSLLERIGKARETLNQFRLRVTDEEGSRTLRSLTLDSIPTLEQKIRSKVEAINERKFGVYPRRIVPPQDGDRELELPDLGKKPRWDFRFRGVPR